VTRRYPGSVPLIDPPRRSTTLADGRRLTWQEFGAPDGEPVLYFHGGGSPGLEGGIFHREAVRNGIRLIAPNRPGAAGSSLCPGRPVGAYSDDVTELLDGLAVGSLACVGESNGGLVTMAVAATIPDRIIGAVPVNPTLPWFDPVARQVSSRSAATGYRLIRYAPRLVAALERYSTARTRRSTSAPDADGPGARMDPAGPPPGIEHDVGEFHRRVLTERAGRQALLAEMRWASATWGFDHYSIPVPLDIFCGAHDAQAPFALVLADRNPAARFHHFPFGHQGYSHPDARRRIIATVAGYRDARR
jgi:pimeloyl-ACP methyl ester carboxylesterase